MMTLLIRTASDPMRWTAAVRSEVLAVDHDQPVFDVKTMKDILAESFSQTRAFAAMLATFSALALLLAAAGVYGVMSYLVEQRAHEIGVRMALGAEPLAILKLVVGHGLALALVGISFGLAAALGLTRFLSSFLYGLSSTNPATLVVSSLVVVGAAALASYIPARRATRVDPMVTLRHE
jgi:putative ABC transport system permease protein